MTAAGNRQPSAGLLAAVFLCLSPVAGCRLPVAGLQAQQLIDERPAPWLPRMLPYPTWDPIEGFAGHLAMGWVKRSNEAPAPVSKAINIEGIASTSGTLGLNVRYDAPGWWRDWRLLAFGGAERLRRVPYFGLGNNSVASDSLGDRFYRYELLRVTAGLVVQRRLAGPVRLLVGGQWRHYNAGSLGDSTAFARDVRAGLISDTVGSNTAELRAGLLLDTRDEESSPSRGLLLEIMGARGLADFDYTRYLAGARLFVPLGEFEQWVIGVRQTVEISRGDAPVFVQYERPTTWYPEDGFGGPTSLRLYAPGRFVAPNRAIGSIDVRKKLLDFPMPTSPMRAWALLFADAGRLWDDGASPSMRGLHWAAGAGGRLQFGKGTIFGLDLGLNGDDGFSFGFATSFAF